VWVARRRHEARGHRSAGSPGSCWHDARQRLLPCKAARSCRCRGCLCPPMRSKAVRRVGSCTNEGLGLGNAWSCSDRCRSMHWLRRHRASGSVWCWAAIRARRLFMVDNVEWQLDAPELRRRSAVWCAAAAHSKSAGGWWDARTLNSVRRRCPGTGGQWWHFSRRRWQGA